jgi:hypothetical protein
MSSRLGSVALFVAMGVAIGGAAIFAQSAIDPPKFPNQPEVPLIKLEKDPAIARGEIAVVRGTANGEGVRYAIASLSILQPVVITLFADAADDLKLTLYKTEWKEPQRAGSTSSSGSVNFAFRTEGGVNVLVQSAGPARPFRLVAWAGEEIHPSMRDVVVTPAEFKGIGGAASGAAAGSGGGTAQATMTEAAGGNSSLLAWSVAAGLGLVVLVLGVIVLRRARK